jgi:hypothetical protein
MRCVRCLMGEAAVANTAPDATNAWEICKHGRCNEGWRSCEPAKIRRGDETDPRFRMVNAGPEKPLNPNHIPPLKA